MQKLCNIDTVMRKYEFGKQMLETELDILIKEFASTHSYNPVEHVKSRIKEKRSIIDKLERKGYEVSLDNVINHIHDIIGIRIVCSFITDVYDIVDMISNSKNIKIKEKKDYISNPKETGYTSFHLIVEIPVYLEEIEYVEAEIQIRTVAMDFWASLDHKIQYKFEGDIPSDVKDELFDYAQNIKELDKKMMNLNDLMKKYKKEL